VKKSSSFSSCLSCPGSLRFPAVWCYRSGSRGSLAISEETEGLAWVEGLAVGSNAALAEGRRKAHMVCKGVVEKLKA